MDFRALTTAQKQIIGETMGPEVVQRLVPDATRIGRVPTVGQKGIDDLYKVSRPDADYVVVEYKFGSSPLGKTADGLQMSDTWLQGTVTGRSRIVESVGKVEAGAVDDAIRQGRIERWLVHTDPLGNVTVGLLDKNGKFIPQPRSTVIKP
jgi:filamentous hemagglutinin